MSTGIALLFFAFKGVDLRSTLHEIKEANLFLILLSVGLSMVAMVSRAYRWNILIEPLGFKPKLSNTTYSLLVGYLANLALPRLGEVTRCGSLTKAEKIPFDELLGTVIAERLIDVICLFLCIVLTAFVEYERLGNFLFQNLYVPVSNKFVNLIESPWVHLALAVAIILFIAFILVMKKNSAKKGVIFKIMTLLKGVLEGIRSVRKIKRPRAFLFHTVLIWTLYFLVSYICFFALPATSHLGWKAGLFVLVVGGMSMSAPVQGGIGIFHLLISQGLLLYSIAYEHGIAFATLLHSTQTIMVIIAGIISFFMLFLVNKKASVGMAINQSQHSK